MGTPVADSDQQDVSPPQGDDGRRPARLLGVPATAIAWAAPFALVLAVLLVRNAFLFSTPEYEDADMGANSILIEQARRFTLLVGHYSREHFNEPGPAFLYVQAWGESVFYDALHVVPTPWNGQLIALYGLNALLAASVVAVGYGWTRSVGGAAATLAVVALLGALHPTGFSSDWMPYVFVPAYFAFAVAIASVAAGRTQDCWLAALAGWFLIHGYAPFLLFVPVLAAVAVAAVLWRRWRDRAKAENPDIERSLFSPPRPRVWIPVAAISAVFAAPIVIELVLHWPGNFARYFSYSSSAKSTGHTTAQLVAYLLWFWWPHGRAWAVPARPRGRRRPARVAAAERPGTALLRGAAGGRRPLDRAVHRLRDGRDRLVQQLLLRRLLLLGGAGADGAGDRAGRDRAAARPDRRRRRASPPRSPPRRRSRSPRSPGSTCCTSTRWRRRAPAAG